MWDLDTQHCFQTLVSHHREVWSFEVVGGAGDGAAELPWLVVASGDPELKVYQLTGEGSKEAKVNMLSRVSCIRTILLGFHFQCVPGLFLMSMVVYDEYGDV